MDDLSSVRSGDAAQHLQELLLRHCLGEAAPTTAGRRPQKGLQVAPGRVVQHDDDEVWLVDDADELDDVRVLRHRGG